MVYLLYSSYDNRTIKMVKKSVISFVNRSRVGAVVRSGALLHANLVDMLYQTNTVEGSLFIY